MSDAHADPKPYAEDIDAWMTESAQLAVADESQRQQRLPALDRDGRWAEAERNWSCELATDLREGRFERLTRYAQACEQALQRKGGAAQPQASSIAGEEGTHDIAPMSESQGPSSQETRRMRSKDVHAALREQEALNQRLGGPSAGRETSSSGEPAARASVGATSNNFAAHFVAGPEPKPPEPGQMETAYHKPDAGVHEEMRAAEAATKWTAEQYAFFCAELEQQGDQDDSVYRRYGLVRPTTRELVAKRWRQRLDEDANLRARFEKTLSDQREVLAAAR